MHKQHIWMNYNCNNVYSNRPTSSNADGPNYVLTGPCELNRINLVLSP